MVSGFFIMILTKQDAQYASQVFIDYYKNFGRIDDYLRKVKLERMEDLPTPLFGYGPEDEMFQDFTMHPEDMQFVCREVPNDMYDNYLEIVTSHAIEKSVPGKSLKWVVYEVNHRLIGTSIARSLNRWCFKFSYNDCMANDVVTESTRIIGVCSDCINPWSWPINCAR